MAKETKEPKVLGCFVKELPQEEALDASKLAIELNPTNRPNVEMLAQAITAFTGERVADEILTPDRLSVLTTKYWGVAGVRLGVSFMDNPDAETRRLILEHMNAWDTYAGANVQFLWSQSGGEIRIAREKSGYWSYLGTDNLRIPKAQATMNLQSFTKNTPISEYKRVVRHEVGHAIGAPHEHMRSQLIARLDVAKTIAYFKRYQGWDEQTTRQQVLTPLSESSIMGTPNADQDSIMCYQLPSSITKDGKPIPGGMDINPLDAEFMRKMYPKVTAPPGPPPEGKKLTVIISVYSDGSFTTQKAPEVVPDV